MIISKILSNNYHLNKSISFSIKYSEENKIKNREKKEKKNLNQFNLVVSIRKYSFFYQLQLSFDMHKPT